MLHTFMLKSGKLLVKLRNWATYELFLVLKVVKVLENYSSTANLLSASFRIDLLQLNSWHSLKTCSYNN